MHAFSYVKAIGIWLVNKLFYEFERKYKTGLKYCNAVRLCIGKAVSPPSLSLARQTSLILLRRHAFYIRCKSVILKSYDINLNDICM